MKGMLDNSMHPVVSRRTWLKASAAVLALVHAWPALGAQGGAWPGLARRDAQIEDLIGRMTLEEKAGQLSLFAGIGPGRSVNPVTGDEPSVQAMEEEVRAGRVTGYFNSFNPYLARRLQEIAVKETRLGIPLIFAADVIHGLRTVYPVPLAEAASFDPELCRRTARLTAVEATAFGLHWTFAPMVDVARDQRWGRVVEGAGEDAFLSALIGAARVRGFQGEDLRAEDSLAACPKHFAGYGAVEGGLEYNTVEISQTALRETHLRPFQACLSAGALTVMTAFNDIGGVPATGSAELLTGILREEWGFPGFAVSDYESERELIAHGYAADEADAVAKSLGAGCDMSMQSGLYRQHVPALVRSGRLTEASVDEAVRRVLRVKKAIGLLDNPFRSLDPARPAQDERRADMVALAREAARKSVVLLKNESNLLPLPKTGKRIAFIGPFVSDRAGSLGPWSIYPDMDNIVSLEDGVRAAVAKDADITFTSGTLTEREIDGGIAEAVAAAQAADIVVMYIGETTAMSGEAASRVEVTVPAVQQRLAEAVAATGTPMAVLLRHGRALALEGAVRDAQAIMCTWFLGSESGNAIADVLFGDHAPQGRLPVSFPQMAGQQPFYYDHRSTGRPQTTTNGGFKARYRETAHRALYPFGHGLGYAAVTYETTQASTPTFSRDGSVRVNATITNTGNRSVHEVAQLYVHDRVAGITRPVRSLRGVSHIDLAAGESRTIEFILSAADLRYIHPDLSDAADPGLFDIWIAGSAETGEPVEVTMT